MYLQQLPEPILTKKIGNEIVSLFSLFLSAILQKDLYLEIVKNVHSIKNVKKALKTMMRTIHFSEFLKDVRKKCGDKPIIYYTYWNDYTTYACVRIKNNDKVVSRIHRADLYLLENNNYYLPYKKSTNDFVDSLFFISKEGLEYYKNTFFDYKDKMQLHYLGVKKQPELAPFCEHKSLKILSFSYLSPIKRVNLIVEALSCIDDIDIEWTHIGGGVLENEIKDFADTKLSNKKNIAYNFTGYMQNEEAVAFVSRSEFDFLLNVSYSEGLPVTMMEAMSLGIPVIATNVGGVNEIVDDTKNGYLIRRDFSADELCNLIREYYDLSVQEKISLRSLAYETWKLKFFDNCNYTKFSDELEKL